MRVLNLIINKFITDKVLKAAYLEKPLNEKYEDIHLHLIFIQEINKNDIFKIIKTLLDDATFVTYYVIKNNIYHAVSEDNLSIYFHIDNKNYPYKNKTYLFDPFDIESDPSMNIDNYAVMNQMIHEVHECINELHNTYKFYEAKEEKLAFLSLSKSLEYLFNFLSCYYIRSIENHSFNDVLQEMEKKKKDELEKIVKAISISSVMECAKMFIWFIDEYINGLPINITKEIDIDYYMFVKKLVLGVKK